MTFLLNRFFGIILILLLLFSCTSITTEKLANEQNIDPLPSWNTGATKTAIIAYVEDVTDPNSANFVQVSERIATFDNDGTLWSEQPMYFQLLFALDRVSDLVEDHPEWIKKEPFKSVLANDMPGLMKQGKEGLFKVIMATHAGVTQEEFEKLVTDWLSVEKHPFKKKAYTDLIYQPMLELLVFLRANDFKTYIVSGGGIDFMRPWIENVYGIPKEQVIGSSLKGVYDFNDGKPVIRKLPILDHFDDKEGKPEAIQKFIGKKPVFAVGNSDGDLQMLRWADSNPLKSFKLFIHHTDSIREWAYDREGHIGNLDIGMDEANEKGWSLVDMAADWKVVYPFELK